MAIVKINDTEYEKKYFPKKIEYYLDDRLKRSTDVRIIDALRDKDKDFFAIVDGSEGCFFEDTLVKTNKGIFKIKDLVDKEEFTLIMKGLEDKEIKGRIIPSGDKEVYELETEDGRKVQATLEHKFFIERNGKIIEIRLKNLKVGDKLICKK